MCLLLSKPFVISISSFCLWLPLTIFYSFFLQCLTPFPFPRFRCRSLFYLHFNTCITFIKCMIVPFLRIGNQWHCWAPVFKSCLISGRQSPPGCLPPLSTVVERAIWTRERSVFPISTWFPLPCTPPALTLQPGPHWCLWDCCRLAACCWTPHRFTNNNIATKGVMEEVPYWCIQTGRSCSCQ